MRQRQPTQKLDRNKKAIHQAKIDEQMKLPINQFLNAKTESGDVKYPISEKLKQFYFLNLGRVESMVRLSNSLVHEVRWHKDMSKKYLQQYESTEPVTSVDKFGKIMSREECYTAYIAESFTVYTVIDKLREHLVQGLLAIVDEDTFTFDQYNDYVVKVEQVIKDMGYDLFPESIVIPDPK